MAVRQRDRSVRTWDLPVRVFHWALVLLVISQLVTASVGGNAMQFHAFGGYAILALVLFRILWGFLGGTHARFRDFVRGPGPVGRYAKSLLRGSHPSHRGHNPLGGWSVLAMLGSPDYFNAPIAGFVPSYSKNIPSKLLVASSINPISTNFGPRSSNQR